MKNLLLRTVTGIIYVALIVFCILFSSYSFLILFSLVAALCLYEFYELINTSEGTRISLLVHPLGGCLLFISFYLYASVPEWGKVSFLIYLCYIAFTFIYFLYDKYVDTLTHLSYIFLGQVYIALPISLLNLIAFKSIPPSIFPTEPYNFLLVLALFVFIWVNDTGAYVVGVSIGKHRLFERISPKKSWEGFFGGLLFTIGAAFVFAHYGSFLSWIHWVALAVIVAVFSTFGDLVESMFKRSLGVKDSGNILPGHGGLLDRFDSLLFAVYGMVIYLYLFH